MNPLLQKIADEFGLNNVPEEQRNEMLARIGGIIYQGVLIRALEVMDEKAQKDFETLLDQEKSPEELFDYLKIQVPNIEEIIKDESGKFKREVTKVMSQIDQTQ